MVRKALITAAATMMAVTAIGGTTMMGIMHVNFAAPSSQIA